MTTWNRSVASPWLVAWSVVGIFLMIDLVWWPFSRLTFVAANTGSFTASMGIIGAMAFISIAIERRVQNDQSRPALVIARAAQSLQLFLQAGATLIALGATGVTFSYLATGNAGSLQDANLAAFDRALGFNWPAFLAWTNQYPMLVWLLRTAYHSTGPQLFLLPVLLAMFLRRDRLAEFMAVLAVSSLLTGVIMAFVPAAGAYAYFKPDSATFDNYAPISGMWHHATLVALRENAAPVLDFSMTQGLVTFPSFHTVLAILTCYAVRGWHWIFWPTVMLNAVVLVGTITEGGHHFVDLLAGAAVVCTAISFVARLAYPREHLAARDQCLRRS